MVPVSLPNGLKLHYISLVESLWKGFWNGTAFLKNMIANLYERWPGFEILCGTFGHSHTGQKGEEEYISTDVDNTQEQSEGLGLYWYCKSAILPGPAGKHHFMYHWWEAQTCSTDICTSILWLLIPFLMKAWKKYLRGYCQVRFWQCLCKIITTCLKTFEKPEILPCQTLIKDKLWNQESLLCMQEGCTKLYTCIWSTRSVLSHMEKYCLLRTKESMDPKSVCQTCWKTA